MIEVPQDILDRIKEREGFSPTVYLDTRSLLTAGTGHLLTPLQKQKYAPDGKPGRTVASDILQSWEASDTLGAYQYALRLVGIIGESDPNLVEALTCMAFQLGDNIPSEFPTLWKLLMAKDWEAAAIDAGTTLWDRQTPVRVQDFQAFLRAIPTQTVKDTAPTPNALQIEGKPPMCP